MLLNNKKNMENMQEETIDKTWRIERVNWKGKKAKVNWYESKKLINSIEKESKIIKTNKKVIDDKKK